MWVLSEINSSVTHVAQIETCQVKQEQSKNRQKLTLGLVPQLDVFLI